MERVITVPGASNKLITTVKPQRYMVRIVNMEAEQNANLTIRLYAKLVPGSFGPVLNTVCPPYWNISQDAELRPIEDPLVLGPGVARGGDLLYEMASYLQFAEPLEGYLEIEDRVSGKRKRIPAVGGTRFDKKTMVPSSGGIEFAEEPNELPSAEPPETYLAGSSSLPAERLHPVRF